MANWPFSTKRAGSPDVAGQQREIYGERGGFHFFLPMSYPVSLNPAQSTSYGGWNIIVFFPISLHIACMIVVVTAFQVVGPKTFGQEVPGAKNLADVKQYLKQPDIGGRDTATAGMTCGVDCLYIMLLVHGMDYPFPQLETSVPIGDHGASLLDLQKASDRFSLPTDAVRCAPDNLQNLPLPAIAHLEATGQTGSYNHYVLLLEVNPSIVKVFDPLDNQLHIVPRLKVGERFSGYFLVPHRREFGIGITIVWCLSGCLVVSLGVWWVHLGPKQKGRSSPCPK